MPTNPKTISPLSDVAHCQGQRLSLSAGAPGVPVRKRGHFSQPSSLHEAPTQTGRSVCSQTGRLATFLKSSRTKKTPRTPVNTPASAHDVLCAGLNAGICRALDVSRVPESRFVARQIAIHQEFHSRQAEKSTAASRLQSVFDQLETLAENEGWSQRKLAEKIGIKESTLRKIRRERLVSWHPRLESALARLSTFDSLPSTHMEVTA